MHFIQDELQLIYTSIVQNQTRIHKVYKVLNRLWEIV